jgi:hypothetical protein
MWYYKLNDKKYINGIWKVPKNCVNAEFGRLKETLFSEYERSQYEKYKPILKSAVISYYSEKCKGKPFSINMFGGDNIILQCEKDEIDEYYLFNYSIVGNYLVYTENQSELLQLRKLLNRKSKIEKITKIYE